MNSLQRIVPFLRPYRWVLTMGLLLVVLPVAMELVVPWLLQYIIDEGIRAHSMSVITWGALIMLASALVGAVATLGQGVYRAQLSQGIAFDMRNALFTHVQQLSFANLDETQTGQLITRLSSDVNLIRMFLSAGLALILRAVLMIVGSVVMLLWLDLKLSLIVLFMLAAAGVLIGIIMRLATPLFVIVQEKLSALNTLVQENLAGARVVKAFVRERDEMSRFAVGNEEYTITNIQAGKLLSLASPVLTLLTNVGVIAILWMGGHAVVFGSLSVGELVAFNNYLLIGMAPLLLLSNMLTMVSRAEASAERYLEVMEMEPAIVTPATSHNPQKMSGRVVFDHASFHYGGVHSGMAEQIATHTMSAAVTTNGSAHAVTNGDKNGIMGDTAVKPTNGTINGAANDGHHGSTNGAANGVSPVDGIQPYEVLHRVSFAVEPGQRVALLGATGSGKSTLVNLLPRFYDVTGGSISIDGVDLRAWDLTALRRQIGVVLQETTLFSGTVRENIAYGRPDASLDEVIAAAQAAQAHDFIQAMPAGYDSRIEERGLNLSGGQKQRMAIAPALLVSPAILILDDSTSALDLETEYRLQQALDQLMNGRTTFIVAQRINSVLNADQILVLERGHIVAQGTHRELLAGSPIYQEIYHSQLGSDQG